MFSIPDRASATVAIFSVVHLITNKQLIYKDQQSTERKYSMSMLFESNGTKNGFTQHLRHRLNCSHNKVSTISSHYIYYYHKEICIYTHDLNKGPVKSISIIQLLRQAPGEIFTCLI